MQKTIYIPIDTTIKNIVECNKLIKRGDILTLQLKIFNNGILVDLTGQTIDLILRKADGTNIEKTIKTVVNGTITAKLDVQATNVHGIVSGEIQIYDTNGQISTNTFTFVVDESIADDVLIKSQDDIETLAELKSTIAEGNTAIQKYKENIIAIAGTAEAVEALNGTKNYIDNNLDVLQSENAKANINILALKKENDRAPTLTSNLKAQNDSATSNISGLTTKNTEAIANKKDIDNSITAAKATKSGLDTSNTTATNTKNELNTSIINAKNSKSALDISKTNADNSKAALDLSIEKADQFIEDHKDIENLAQEVNNKMELFIGETLPETRKENTLYFKVTDTIGSGTTDAVKVSPTMGIKIV